MQYRPEDSTVTYHSDKPTGPTAGSETTDALEFLARLTSHIPDKGQVLQRYYGFYSSRQRGKRRKATGDTAEEPLVMVEPEPEVLRKEKRRWAELLRHILEVDPLACPRWGEQMRITAFITEPRVIDRILDHGRRSRSTRRRAPARSRMVARASANGFSPSRVGADPSGRRRALHEEALLVDPREALGSE